MEARIVPDAAALREGAQPEERQFSNPFPNQCMHPALSKSRLPAGGHAGSGSAAGPGLASEASLLEKRQGIRCLRACPYLLSPGLQQPQFLAGFILPSCLLFTIITG